MESGPHEVYPMEKAIFGIRNLIEIDPKSLHLTCWRMKKDTNYESPPTRCFLLGSMVAYVPRNLQRTKKRYNPSFGVLISHISVDPAADAVRLRWFAVSKGVDSKDSSSWGNAWRCWSAGSGAGGLVFVFFTSSTKYVVEKKGVFMFLSIKQHGFLGTRTRNKFFDGFGGPEPDIVMFKANWAWTYYFYFLFESKEPHTVDTRFFVCALIFFNGSWCDCMRGFYASILPSLAEILESYAGENGMFFEARRRVHSSHANIPFFATHGVAFGEIKHLLVRP